MESTAVKYVERRNYSWAAFLILVGVMFLLNTTNVIGWGIWMYVVRFWPVLIVLIGVRIILGSSLVARILGMLVTVLLTVAVFGISYIQFTGKGISFLPESVNSWVLKGGSGMFNLGQELVQESGSISFDEYSDVTSRYFTLDVGACKFDLVEDDIEEYISYNSKFPKTYESPELIHSIEEGLLDIQLIGASSKSLYIFHNEAEYNVTLGQLSIPTSFDIKLGAGSGTVFLESVLVNDFWAEVGTGQLDMTFTIDTVPSGDVRFTVGAGKMDLHIPTRVEYSLDYDLGVGKITIDGIEVSGISGGKGKYTSPNYKTSDMELDIYVTVGVGAFNISSN